MSRFLSFPLMALIAGCASIQRYETLDRDPGTVLSASINEAVYKIDRESDLPNWYGRADIFGGKVDEGSVELRFMGLNEDGLIIFRLTDTEIESNETTMSRYRVSSTTTENTTSQGTATVTGNTISGSGTSSTVTTTRERPDATIVRLPPNTVEFLFNPDTGQLPLGRVVVDVLAVAPYSITYRLELLDEN